MSKQHYICQQIPTPKSTIKTILDDIVSIAGASGAKVAGYATHSLNRYHSLDDNTKQDTLLKLNNLREILQLPSKGPTLDAISFRHHLYGLGYVAPDSFWEHCEEGDIIEAYNLEHTQIFRNMEFMKLTSYDMLTLAIIPFPELFDRDAKIQELIIQKSIHVSLYEDTAVSWDVPDHILTEKYHHHKAQFKIHCKYLSPIFNIKTNDRSGWISTIKVTPEGSAWVGPNVKPLK